MLQQRIRPQGGRILRPSGGSEPCHYDELASLVPSRGSRMIE